jgi:autotransporter-associated beta strand protein
MSTVNLNGGTLTARRVSGNNGTGDSTLNLNGGTLRAGSSAVAEWVTGIDNVVIQSGGAKIDTNGKSVQFAPAISEDSAGRTLTKLGTGTLFINGFGSYTGLTTVSAGTLAGIGNIAGPVTVSAGASVNPGITLGALFVESINFASTASLTIDLGVVDDTLVVANELNLGNSPALVLTGTPNLPVHVIASYTTRIGTFGSVTLPPGYTIDYNFEGNNQIALVQTPTPYTTWASSKGLTGANNGPTQDPEFDGISNLLEFILGGNPLASDPSILPVQTLTPTDFVFTFSRADESESETTQKFQYGSTLTNWTDVPIGAVSSPGVGITENGASPDTVVVTIPRTNAIGGKLFGRLNAVK